MEVCMNCAEKRERERKKETERKERWKREKQFVGVFMLRCTEVFLIPNLG